MQNRWDVLITDYGSILSASTTGLMMPGVLRYSTHEAAFGAYGDLNDRLLRARAGFGMFNGGFRSAPPCPCFGGIASSGRGMFNYLKFAANQNIDYRVALGLAEGEEVEFTDTLAFGETTVWGGYPAAMMGGPVSMASVMPVTVKAVVAAPEGSAKNPYGGKGLVETDPYSRFEVFTQFNYGYFDQDNLTSVMRGADNGSYAGTIGLEYRIAPQLLAGAAFSHVWSDTEFTSSLGSIDLEGNAMTGYVTWFVDRFYLDALYSYGDYNSATKRNTLLGRNARGDTDSNSHTVSLNTGMTLKVTDQITTGPVGAMIYSTGDIDGYTETGGGSANLIYPDDNFESMLGWLGWQVTHQARTGFGRLTTQARAGWAHQFMPESDPVSATLETSPFLLVSGASATRVGGFSAEGPGAHSGTDWLELGLGVRLDFLKGWSARVDYEGQFFRNNASAHFGTARLGYEW